MSSFYRILLQCGADLDKQDIDGWTPMHAASYWGQKEAAELLATSLADMDAKNFVVSFILIIIIFINTLIITIITNCLLYGVERKYVGAVK